MSILSIFAVSKNYSQPLLVSQDPRKEVYDIARKSLIELAVSLAIGSAAILFVATPIQGALLFAAIAVQTICNIALRLSESYARKNASIREMFWIAFASSYLRPTLFSYLTAFNGQILIHELGHALGAKLLFRNARPEIAITPYLGGVTTWNRGALSHFGEKLGKGGAMLAVTLMGPMTSLLISSVAIIIGILVQSRFEELSSYLTIVGKGDFYGHALYAFTAFFIPRFGHDYVELARYGIHPLACSVALLAIPFLLTRFITPENTPNVSGMLCK